MAITYTVPGIKLLDQLKEVSNPRYDCVFTSNAMLVNAYRGTSYTGSQLKAMDSDYGPAYTGGASEARLADTMARLGVTVTRTPSPTQAGLISILHTEIAKGHGVIVTMPSQWNTAPMLAGSKWNPRTYSGPSHVGLACGIGPGMIRVANPWGAFWQDESDAWWATRLLAGEVWTSAKAGGVSVGVPSGWKDDGKTLTAPNGVTVVRGFREWVLGHTWDANNWPLKPEQVVTAGSIEPGNANVGPGSRQDFRLSSLGWTQAKNVYTIWTGQDIVALESQLAAALAHVTALEAQLAAAQATTPAPAPDPLKDKSLAIMTQLAALVKDL